MLEAGLATELHDALAALRAGWPELAQDLALGRLSPQPGLPEDARARLQALLAPDAARAAELRAECARGFEGIVQRLWPQLEVVVVGTAHGTEQLYCDALRQADCKGLPFYCPFYWAAGGECPRHGAVPMVWPGCTVGTAAVRQHQLPLPPQAWVHPCATSLPGDLPALQSRLCPGTG